MPQPITELTLENKNVGVSKPIDESGEGRDSVVSSRGTDAHGRPGRSPLVPWGNHGLAVQGYPTPRHVAWYALGRTTILAGHWMSESWWLGGHDCPHGAHVGRGGDGCLALARDITLVPWQRSPQLFQRDVLIGVDQLTGCRGRGEGRRLTGHCGGGLKGARAPGGWTGARILGGQRSASSLRVGRESGLGGVRGGGGRGGEGRPGDRQLALAGNGEERLADGRVRGGGWGDGCPGRHAESCRGKTLTHVGHRWTVAHGWRGHAWRHSMHHG